MKLEEMKKNELLDFFITKIAGHEKEVEIAYIGLVYGLQSAAGASSTK